jgi:hypothetical protein
MKIMRVLSALLLVSTLAIPTAAHERANKSGARAHIGTRSPVGSQPQACGIEGREIIAPPWSAACMTDHGPSECGEHMWFYGSSDALARYRNAF